MKKYISVALVALSVFIIFLGLLTVSPYYFYNQVIKNQHHSEWINIDLSNPLLFKPLTQIVLSGDEPNYNSELWRQFHFQDVLLNLPVEDPFYLMAPIVDKSTDEEDIVFGIKFLSPSLKNLARLYLSNDFYFPNVYKNQKIFQLPVVENHLRSYSQDQVWRDLFTKDIKGWNISLNEMLYNLYLLELRNLLFPKNFINFGLSNDKTIAIIEVQSSDKDFKTEYILTYRRNKLYAFLLVSNIHTAQSKVLRSRILQEMKFEPSSPSLRPLILKEFETFPFKKKISQLGMLTLLSAWTHEPEQDKIVKQMIQYLERGKKNQLQLDPLFKYAQMVYGETFSASTDLTQIMSDEIRLLRNIELESKQFPVLQKVKNEPQKKKTLSDKLREAKEKKTKNRKNEILMD
jgi:hypothetical protein